LPFWPQTKISQKKTKTMGTIVYPYKNVFKKKKVTIIPRKIYPNLAINQKQNLKNNHPCIFLAT
jgi:hypothetical protein